MCSGRLFQATGPTTRNARLPSCSLVLGTTKSDSDPALRNFTIKKAPRLLLFFSFTAAELHKRLVQMSHNTDPGDW